MEQNRFRALKRLAALAAIVAAASSCGDVVRSSRSPVILVINQLAAARGSNPTQFFSNLLSDVITNLQTPPPCSPTNLCPTFFNDVGQAQLSTALKDIGTTANPATATTNNQVTINRVHVQYIRADRPNGGTPGVDVPYPFDGAATGTIPLTGSLTVSFELVRNVAKQEPPLIGLQTSGAIINTIAQVTFYGTDLVGNEVSVSGQIQIDFGNFADQ